MAKIYLKRSFYTLPSFFIFILCVSSTSLNVESFIELKMKVYSCLGITQSRLAEGGIIVLSIALYFLIANLRRFYET